MRLRASSPLLVTALLTVAAACSYDLRAGFPAPAEPRRLDGPPVVAFLGVRDLRLARGGARTHREEQQPAAAAPMDPWSRRSPYVYPLDPWNRYELPAVTQGDVRVTATGELGTMEVSVPLEAAFGARFTARVGTGGLRDASEDALAADPDAARVAAFFRKYPNYGAVTWLEVVRARADLPDTSLLQSMLVFGSVCTLGVAALGFLVPLRLDTPVEYVVRGYLARRGALDKLEAASVEVKRTLPARGSAGLDVDAFRADVADVLSRHAGARLADDLADRLGSTWGG